MRVSDDSFTALVCQSSAACKQLAHDGIGTPVRVFNLPQVSRCLRMLYDQAIESEDLTIPADVFKPCICTQPCNTGIIGRSAASWRSSMKLSIVSV